MERLACEFSLIRYVPDVVKGEFVNIGVVLREAAPASGAAVRAEVRFTRDWGRVRCLDADADTGLLEALEQEIAGRMRAGVSVRDPKGVLETLEDSLSNSVQMTEPRATLAENMAAEMELLMRMYVEPMRVPRVRTRSGRAAILKTMETAFGDDVWAFIYRRTRAAQFTRKGDPLRIDCWYQAERQANPDAIIRMFQAVSLRSDVGAAKGLALSSRELRAGFRRELKAELRVTAVVESLQDIGDAADEDDEGVLQYQFAKKTMEDEQIEVLTVSELDGAAETARFELMM